MTAEAETKFTPGPWFAKPWGDDLSVYVTREDEAEIRVAYVESGYWFLHTDYLLSSDERREKAVAIREANARLIAAAPELFSTLARIVAVHDERNLRGQQICLAERAAITQARKALSKARGEA